MLSQQTTCNLLACAEHPSPFLSNHCTWHSVLLSAHFYRASICEGGLGSRNSVHPSVCHMCGLWQNKMMHCGYFDTTRKGNHSATLDTNSGWWATLPSLWNLRSKWPTPFEKRRLRQISAHIVSTVKDSGKSSITTNIKSTTGFQWAIDEVRMLPLSPERVAQKAIFFVFWVKVQLIVSSAVNLVHRWVS